MRLSVSFPLLLAVASFHAASAAPFDLGSGGVYKDSAAQAYFSDRFGSGFLSGLASKLRGVKTSSSAAATSVTPRKAKTVTASTSSRRPVNVVKEQEKPAVKKVSTKTTKVQQQEPTEIPAAQHQQQQQEEVLYYGDAKAPSTKMVAEDIQSVAEEPKDSMNAKDIITAYYDSNYNYYEDVGSNSIDYYYYEK